MGAAREDLLDGRLGIRVRVAELKRAAPLSSHYRRERARSQAT
jgi:hypothetical protein